MAIIEMMSSQWYRGVVRLACHGNDVVVSYEVAERIWVREEPSGDV